MESNPEKELAQHPRDFPRGPVSLAKSAGFLLVVVSAFHLALAVPSLSCLVLVYAFGLMGLAETSSFRAAFRWGFLAGMLIFTPHLLWFWKIFGAVAICLWAVVSFFHGIFVLAIRCWDRKFGAKWMWIVAPCFWTALEFFRGELYYLKFSWLSVGYAFSNQSGFFPIGILGVYGSGFVVFLIAALSMLPKENQRRVLSLGAACALIGLMTNISPSRLREVPTKEVNVAGIQLEFPASLEIPKFLDKTIEKFPKTELILLSEYTFESTVPQNVLNWCKTNRRYLVAGGKEDLPEGKFNNIAFVVGPEGEIIFKQGKSVPIQFFKDGEPAREQKVWESPWGKIGICICYDLSYRRVIDRFVDQEATALLVPFMDIVDWGEYQHKLHSRVPPLRAKEYRIPVFRIGSSGVSQLIDKEGHENARGTFPGQGEVIGGTLRVGKPGSLPLDHWLAPSCVALSILMVLRLMLAGRGPTGLVNRNTL